MTTAEIIDRLKQLTTDLLWVSESDYPFEIITWERGVEMTPMALFGVSSSPNTEIEIVTTTDLFEPVLTIEDWHGEEELAIVNRYTDLLHAIDTNLSEILVLRVGKIEIAIYIIGKTPDGDIIGLKTQAIET